AVAQVDQAVETVKNLLVMGDGDDAGFLLDGKLAQKVHHQSGPLAVERGGRFVGQDDAGTVGQRPRNGHSLRLATRQERWLGRGAVVDLEITEQIAGTRATLL